MYIVYTYIHNIDELIPNLRLGLKFGEYYINFYREKFNFLSFGMCFQCHRVKKKKK